MFKGAIYHAYFRGNARRRIFVDDRDHTRFLERLAERVRQYQVRLYLYCLMANHVHLLVETPMGNLPRFMGSLETSYAVYFNLRHHRVGHLTQGRYKAPLVEGNDYLLRLSRYIHLNPVCVESQKERTLAERVDYLHNYRWSSYRGYVGLAPCVDYVDYGPLLALVGCGAANAPRIYQEYVEAGIAKNDQEFVALMRRSKLGIGSEEFMAELQGRHERLAEEGIQREDVSFRKTKQRAAPESILEQVCAFYGITRAELWSQRKNDLIKPVTAELLIRIGGLTQREAAHYLGLQTGAAVCQQLRRLRASLNSGMGRDLDVLRRRFNI